MKSSKTILSSLETLPGELRNLIFELCIEDAIFAFKMSSRGSSRYGGGSNGANRFTSASSTGIRVSVLPGWSGPGRMKTTGIGPLSLLFVNKQIHNEVSSLVDFKAEEVSIGPHSLQHADEDPNIRWEVAYSLLENRPHLKKHIKKVKVFLPWFPQDLLESYWKLNFGHKWKYKNEKSYGLMVVPRLTEFLKTFKSLSKLDVVLVAEVEHPPEMEPLLQLFDLCGSSTTIEVVDRHSQNRGVSFAPPPILMWTATLDSLLLYHRGVQTETNRF